jgi:hypothetical protein
MLTRLIVVLLVSLVHSSLGLAQAQQPKKVARVGFLSLAFPPPATASLHPSVAAFYQGLREVGYTEGKNLVVEYRYSEGNGKRFAKFATEFVSSKVDLIVAPSTQRSWLRGTRPLQFLLSCYLSAIPLMRNSSVACRDRAGISLG